MALTLNDVEKGFLSRPPIQMVLSLSKNSDRLHCLVIDDEMEGKLWVLSKAATSQLPNDGTEEQTT